MYMSLDKCMSKLTKKQYFFLLNMNFDISEAAHGQVIRWIFMVTKALYRFVRNFM